MEGVIWVGGLRHATPKAAVLRALAAVGVQGPVRVHFNRGTGTGQASSALATMPLPDITKALSLNTTFVPDLSDFPLRVEMAKGQPKTAPPRRRPAEQPLGGQPPAKRGRPGAEGWGTGGASSSSAGEHVPERGEQGEQHGAQQVERLSFNQSVIGSAPCAHFGK